MRSNLWPRLRREAGSNSIGRVHGRRTASVCQLLDNKYESSPGHQPFFMLLILPGVSLPHRTLAVGAQACWQSSPHPPHSPGTPPQPRRRPAARAVRAAHTNLKHSRNRADRPAWSLAPSPRGRAGHSTTAWRWFAHLIRGCYLLRTNPMGPIAATAPSALPDHGPPSLRAQASRRFAPFPDH